jgi:predicted ATPase
METVLIGLNATGKSNFMEALVIIFRDLDLQRSPQFGKKRETLEYFIHYNCREYDIKIECSKKEGYLFEINGDKLKNKSEFFSNKSEYLPKHIFFYYSGISDRVKELYSEHEKKYYQEIIKKDAKPEHFNEIRPIFLVQNIHASFALIAFYMFREREKETIQFLKEELKIHDFSSALFVLKEPSWKRQGKKVEDLWGAQGLVKQLITDILEYSIAPIANEETIHTNYKKTEKQSRLYLYINSKTRFKELIKNKYDEDKVRLFNALESIHLSDLMQDVKIKILKENVDGALSINELSEGEKQLLTVLGLLKFTKDDESLILLDEPDTHLNPLWKWKYLDFIDKVVSRSDKTQIIFCTHDPLVIGNLKKNQVKIFKNGKSTGKIYIQNPSQSPREMSVAKILTSELFGIPSIMSKKLEDLLNLKRNLQAKFSKDELSDNDRREFERLKKYFDEIGYNDDTADSRYNLFLKLTSEREEFSNRKYTQEETEELDRIAKEVLNEIMKEDKK